MVTTSHFYFTEIRGLGGLLDHCTDDLLEQIRKLQLSMSPRRKVGRSVDEFRSLIRERLLRSGGSSSLFPDSLLTILYLMQTRSGNDLGAPVVIGMVSVTVISSHCYNEAELFDLIVREKDRGQGVSRRLLEYVHALCQKTDVTRVIARIPQKHGVAYAKHFLGFHYDAGDNGILVYRFRTEG